MTDRIPQTRHPAAQVSNAIVYVREADPEQLPEHLQDVGGTPYAIHDSSGAVVGLAPDRRQAFALARRNDLTPVSVH